MITEGDCREKLGCGLCKVMGKTVTIPLKGHPHFLFGGDEFLTLDRRAWYRGVDVFFS